MCIRITYAAHVLPSPWNPATRTITLPAGLNPPATLTALRATLNALGIPQPRHGAECWCGDPLDPEAARTHTTHRAR